MHAGDKPPEVALKLAELLRGRGIAAYVFRNDALEMAWRCYDAIIFVEAIGGVVRLVCPLLRGKEEDPPVLVVERRGRYIVPLLGSHRGANELARELAPLLGAEAVITTAVEDAGATPAEIFERVMLCGMDAAARLLVNKALKEGRRVCVRGRDPPAALRGYSQYGDQCDVVIDVGGQCAAVCCRPYDLFVGFGATSDAGAHEIVEAILGALSEMGASLSQVRAVASIRPVVSEVAAALGVPGILLRLEDLKSDECLSPSRAVEALGVPGVAEPSALAVAGRGGRLLYRKRARGRVTVAVAARL